MYVISKSRYANIIETVSFREVASTLDKARKNKLDTYVMLRWSELPLFPAMNTKLIIVRDYPDVHTLTRHFNNMPS